MRHHQEVPSGTKCLFEVYVRRLRAPEESMMDEKATADVHYEAVS